MQVESNTTIAFSSKRWSIAMTELFIFLYGEMGDGAALTTKLMIYHMISTHTFEYLHKLHTLCSLSFYTPPVV